ncbi:uncharacterized protein [Anoplolepis gracilipes]|uniref:uncharacterized protein n=1 Tax=Anoplolepis gracilipes TaxID=354296 RepID=UPI003BA10896
MAGSDNIREREKMAKEIAKTSESIRKKHRALKTGNIDDDIAVKTHFKPIIEPLQKIVDNSFAVKNKSESSAKIKIKRYKEDEKEEAKDEEVEKEEEEDATPKKRKRSDVLLYEPSIASTPLTAPTSVNEDVFETSGNMLESSFFRNKLQTPEVQEALREYFGPLGQKYIGALFSGDKNHEIDHVYGVYFDRMNELRLGNKQFNIKKDDSIIIDDVRYIGTPGLYELIFKRIPDDELYTRGDDLEKYKSILLVTNAHRRDYDAQGHLKGNRGYKYKHIIAPLMSLESKNTKSGEEISMPRAMTLTNNMIDYVHWDDPNELVDRLRLLNASRQAGHNAHDNEIQSIIEELREAGIIIN